MKDQYQLLLKSFQHPQLAFEKIKRYLDHHIEDTLRILSSRESDEIINQKEIRFVGLRRTGNHAVINWILKQNTGVIKNLNSVIVNDNPYRYKYENLRDNYPEHKNQAELYRQEAIGNFIKKDCLIYSYEDFELSQVFNHNFERKHDLYLGKTNKRYDVLLLRDPFNLIASRLKSDMMSVKVRGQNIIDLWIAYAKEFLGETEYLKFNKVFINYNDWVSNQNYRQMLAEKLQLEFSDAGLYEVRSLGGGSSFDGVGFNGNARNMDLLNRWQKFIDDPIYRQLVNNEELIAYSEKIFGHLPGTEKLRSK